jgi:hypothetical protein
VNTKKALEGLLAAAPSAPKAPKPPEPPKAPKPKGRTLGNIYAALEAQKIYNPSMPSVPKPSPANASAQGLAPNLGTEGAWGKPA